MNTNTLAEISEQITKKLVGIDTLENLVAYKNDVF